jgi:RHS repeat-associated protein
LVVSNASTTVLSVSYSYDSRNRVSAITGNGKKSQFSYDAAGRRVGATWPNGTTASYSYDAANQLSALSHQQSGTPIASFAYTYDANGNRTSMTTLEGVNNYTYNANNWLTGVTYPDGRTQEFTYDPVGNRVSLLDSGVGGSPVQYTYDAANRLLSAVSAVETNYYTYDGAGRLTNQVVNGQSRSYAYSFRSQMTGLTDTNAAGFAYAFDGEGNRVSSVGTAGPAVRFVYDGPNVVLDLDAATLEPVSAYVHGLGIDQPIERIQFISGVADGRHVYHTDALGSVWAMTDDLQIVAQAYTYEAFGKLRAESGTGLLFPNRYTYTAREALGDSGALYYYRWRVMDPNVGRFTSEDPLGFVDGSCRYTYVRNDPMGRKDATGRKSCSWRCNLAAAAAVTCVVGADVAGAVCAAAQKNPALLPDCFIALTGASLSCITAGSALNSCLNCLRNQPCPDSQRIQDMQNLLSTIMDIINILKGGGGPIA